MKKKKGKYATNTVANDKVIKVSILFFLGKSLGSIIKVTHFFFWLDK